MNYLIFAVAISNLNTMDNCISAWYVDKGMDEDIKKSVLALASGFRTMNQIKAVLLDYPELEKSGLRIEKSDGNIKYRGV